MIHRFIWGSSNGSPSLALVKWDTVKSPLREGGLGFGDLRRHNQALIMKRGFQLITDVDKPWVHVLKAKYKWDGDLPMHIFRPNYSRLWRGISQSWDVVCSGICWQVRDGWHTDFWWDIWLNGTAPLVTHCLLSSLPNPMPVDAMISASGQWD
ncbi:hypothetical protein V6N12_031211 [Hibiscus sabdariffa]|uniref:Uncharacterized protein n=1 Tax=Hibiscus sabdariffa TaxID=183260 RepID=A0ABR2E8B0_9ROSI